MADNFIANPGAGGDTFAADEVGGVKIPRSKIVLGADGVNDGDVSASNPMPIAGEVTTDGLTDAELRANPVPISGTVTANTGLSQPLTDTQLRATPVPVSGTVSTGGLTDTQLRAAPVEIMGDVAIPGLDQPLTDAQLRDSPVSVTGLVAIASLPNSPIEVMFPVAGAWTYAAASGGISNTTTAVTFKAAAGGGVRNYISAIQISSDALGAATELAIRDGAGGTVLWRCKIGTAGLIGGISVEFPTPLRSTANTLLEVVTLTASVTGAVFFNAQGYLAA